ncbi:MAG: hypothetical protein D6713_09510 [Deltaproteobacteria bacterium]|nr:MAG: hypothetical protein D6713_09510 [Deltaproteobacteria bacterium]
MGRGSAWFLACLAAILVFLTLSQTSAPGQVEQVSSEGSYTPIEGEGRVTARDLIEIEELLRRARIGDALERMGEAVTRPVSDERKGYVYFRRARVEYALGRYQDALEDVKRAITLLEGKYLLLSAMRLRMKIYADIGWYREARQIARYLLDEGFVDVSDREIYLFIARADAALEDAPAAVRDYEKAFLLAPLEERERIFDEMSVKVGGVFARAKGPTLFNRCLEGINSLRFRVFVLESAIRFCLRGKFLGFAQLFLSRYAPLAPLEERDDVLDVFRYQMEEMKRDKPKVALYLPFDGKFAEYGMNFLMGVELAARKQALAGGVFDPPWFILVRDTSSSAVLLDRDISTGSLGRDVVAVGGPLLSREAYYLLLTPDAPPVFYLGQRFIQKEGPFVNFALKPFHEMLALATSAYGRGVFAPAIFYPENGYGRAYRDALVRALLEMGIRIAGEFSYSPETKDFIPLLRNIVGWEVFKEFSEAEEKGVTTPVPFDGAFILDTPGRGLLLHSQMIHSNIKVPAFVPVSWSEKEVLDDLKGDVKDLYTVTDFPFVSDDREVKGFIENFTEVFGLYPTRYAAYGYDFGTFITSYLREKYLMEKSYGLSTPPLVDWMGERRLDGVTAPGEMDGRGVFVRNLYTLRVDSGRIEIVFPVY